MNDKSIDAQCAELAQNDRIAHFMATSAQSYAKIIVEQRDLTVCNFHSNKPARKVTIPRKFYREVSDRANAIIALREREAAQQAQAVRS